MLLDLDLVTLSGRIWAEGGGILDSDTLLDCETLVTLLDFEAVEDFDTLEEDTIFEDTAHSSCFSSLG